MKRQIVHTLQKYLFNPPIKLALGMGVPIPGYALLETTGRKTGKTRRTPVGNGRIGNQFWLVAEHGMRAGYVRNMKNRELLVAPDIHNPRPAALPHSFASHPDLPKPARPANHVPTFWVGCNECHEIRTLVLAKEFVGNGEVRRRLDNRLHNFSCTPLDTISQDNCVRLQPQKTPP